MVRQALGIIRNEHRMLGALLHSLRALGACAASAEDFEILRAILVYIQEFPERRHHHEESQVIFPKLRARSRRAAATLDRLEVEHVRSEEMVHDLARTLLAFERLGEPCRQPFLDAVARFAEFCARHMELEERVVLKLAAEILRDEDWHEIDGAFQANRSHGSGLNGEDVYANLLRRIASRTPGPTPPPPERRPGRRSRGGQH